MCPDGETHQSKKAKKPPRSSHVCSLHDLDMSISLKVPCTGRRWERIRQAPSPLVCSCTEHIHIQVKYNIIDD